MIIFCYGQEELQLHSRFHCPTGQVSLLFQSVTAETTLSVRHKTTSFWLSPHGLSTHFCGSQLAPVSGAAFPLHHRNSTPSLRQHCCSQNRCVDGIARSQRHRPSSAGLSRHVRASRLTASTFTVRPQLRYRLPPEGSHVTAGVYQQRSATAGGCVARARAPQPAF